MADGAGPPGPAPLGPVPGIGFAPATSAARAWRLDGARLDDLDVRLAEEVPVAFAYNRVAHAVMMATPADLEDLAVGFTVTEGIAAAGDIAALDVERHARGIDLAIAIPADAAARLGDRARRMGGRTGCGLCGVPAIEEALRPVRHVARPPRVAPEALHRAVAALGARQPANRDVHALHAAGWATAAGDLRVVREDVGRHNALDKVVGALVRAGTDPAGGMLLVTSRASMELVQKALAVGVPLLAAVSRPTALAVRLAERAGMTLVGLARDGGAVAYAHPGALGEGGTPR